MTTETGVVNESVSPKIRPIPKNTHPGRAPSLHRTKLTSEPLRTTGFDRGGGHTAAAGNRKPGRLRSTVEGRFSSIII